VKNLSFIIRFNTLKNCTARLVRLECLHYARTSWQKLFHRLSQFFQALLGRTHLGVEQQIDCFIIHNRQAIQSKGRSVDWILKDNMVSCLIFCATLTSRRSGYTPFVQTGAESSETGAETVELDPGCSGTFQEGGLGMKVRRLVVLCNLSAFHCTSVISVSWTDELLCGGYKWVSRFEMPCIPIRLTGERWVEQMFRLHGTAC